MEDMSKRLKLVKGGSSNFGILQDEVLGAGASAVVKKAYNLDDPSELYAVKIINIQDSERKELALKELDAVKGLPIHPNLVQIQKIKVESLNNIYIFMEFCNGGTLFDLVVKRKLAEEEIYDLFCQLMRGYKVMFQAKVLHEDIKLENILIHNNVYKISDFGLAILSENFKYGQRRKGTMSYMPYQKLVKKDYTANVKSDIYSLGVLMYEVICGRHPYISGKHDISTWVRMLRQANLKNDLLVKYSLRFQVLFTVVLKMLEKLESDRIAFPELWDFYLTSEVLAGHRAQKTAQARQKPEVPLKYQVLSISQASIVSFGTQKQDLELLNIRTQCEFNRKISHFIAVIIMSMQTFDRNEDEKECARLELVLHLTRHATMKPVEIDWLSSPPLIREYCEKYQSDCNFVKQELYSFMLDYPSKSESKDMVALYRDLTTSQEIFDNVKTAILNLFKTRFTVVKINCFKEVQLLFYLISFVKLISDKEILVQKLTEVQRQGEVSLQMKPAIKEFFDSYNVVIDEDQEEEKELSEEFELLIFD